VQKSCKVLEEKKLNGLLFGFGRMGITHIALFNKYFSDEIKWDVFEPSWKTRFMVRFFGKMAGVSSVTEETIRKKNYDLAIICSPPQFHQSNYELVKNNTKKIFLEKPGFVDAPDAKNLYVGYVLRHSPCVAEFIKRIRGKNTKKVKIEIRANTVIEDGSGWRASSKGGGVVNEFGSHAINLAKYLVGDEYSITKFETSKIVSTSCPDTCLLVGHTESGVGVEIHLNWSDASVRKPTYKISVVFKDDSELATDLFQIWNLSVDNIKSEVSGVANWDSECKFYIRGLEFSDQARYFVSQCEFSKDLADSMFTDKILKENS
jgi:predicted dehydrogenase